MNDPIRLVCYHRNASDWQWIGPRTDPREFSWEYVPTPANGQKELLATSWRAVRLLQRSQADALVMHGPFLSLRCGAIRRMLRVKAPLIAYSFHFDVDPPPAKQRLIALMARGIDRFIVYSRAEIDHYHCIFGIPRDRIEMTYWGIRRPEPLAEPEPCVEGDYLCTIGGSARDYRTFLAAAALVPEIPFVAVVRPQSLEGLEVPSNVRVFVNLPYDHMANVLVHSRGTVIPLTVPARSGHSVLVLAWHHAKAVLISDVPGVRDYVRDGQNALACPPSDPEAMASAMKRLWNDRPLCRSLGDEGLRFAQEHCTEEAIVSHFRGCLARLGLG